MSARDSVIDALAAALDRAALTPISEDEWEARAQALEAFARSEGAPSVDPTTLLLLEAPLPAEPREGAPPREPRSEPARPPKRNGVARDHFASWPPGERPPNGVPARFTLIGAALVLLIGMGFVLLQRPPAEAPQLLPAGGLFGWPQSAEPAATAQTPGAARSPEAAAREAAPAARACWPAEGAPLPLDAAWPVELHWDAEGRVVRVFFGEALPGPDTAECLERAFAPFRVQPSGPMVAEGASASRARVLLPAPAQSETRGESSPGPERVRGEDRLRAR
jgi:hypothetical protein